MSIYIVWNEARTEGYATTDAGVAYEARKGADSNCFTAEGERMKLAQAFCELTGEESCTIQMVIDGPDEPPQCKVHLCEWCGSTQHCSCRSDVLSLIIGAIITVLWVSWLMIRQ